MSSPRAILLLILVTAAALRVPVMFESLWFDEYYTTSHTIGSFALLLKSLYTDIHPPAYYAFMTLWTNVFGDSELSVRTPPLLCGLGTIWLVRDLTRSVAGERAGLVAAAIMATAPVHIWYSTEARPYSAQLFLLLWAVQGYTRLLRGGGLGCAIGYATALSLLVFTHYYMAAYAIAFSLLAWFDELPRRRFVWFANAATLLSMALYVGFKLSTSEFETGRGYLREFTLGEWWTLFYDWFLSGYTISLGGDRDGVVATVAYPEARQIALRVFQAVGIVATAVGALVLWRARTRPPGWHALVNLLWLPLFLLGLAFVGKDQTYIERSVLPAYPFFVVVLAVGLARCGPKTLLAAAFVALHAVALTAFYLERDTYTVYRPNPDWRAAAAYLGEEIDRHGPGLEVYTPYASPDPLSYYDARIQQAKTFEPADHLERRLLDGIERHFGTDSWLGSRLDSLARSMTAEFEELKREKQNGARMLVHWFSRRDPLVSADRERPFYVVYPGDPDGFRHPGTVELVEHPDIEQVELRAWRWLRVHKLRFRK